MLERLIRGNLSCCSQAQSEVPFELSALLYFHWFSEAVDQVVTRKSVDEGRMNLSG